MHHLQTSSLSEAVHLVRLFRLGAVKFLDLVNVGSFVERATQSCLELSVVRLRVTFLPTTCVLCPFLHHNTPSKPLVTPAS